MKDYMEYNTVKPLITDPLNLLETSEKGTTSLQETNGPSSMCPLFGSFTVAIKLTNLFSRET